LRTGSVRVRTAKEKSYVAARFRAIRGTGAPLVEERASAYRSLPSEPPYGFVTPHAAAQPAETLRRATQSAHTPKMSTTWLGSAKPWPAATSLAHASTGSASISTVLPQLRQIRW
jgi:hypothetical protein